MFTDVSENFNEEIAKQSRTFRARMIFDDFSIGNGIYSIKLQGGSNLDEILTIGTTTAKTVDIDVVEIPQNIKNRKFRLEIGLDVGGFVEYIPFGDFYVRSAVTKDRKTSISAADMMYLADKEYKTFLTYPITADKVIEEISRILGFSYEISGLQDVVIFTTPVSMTIREVIGHIAALCGKNARFDRVGNLDFYWYNDGGYSTNGDYISEADVDESDFEVKYIMAEVTDKITVTAGNRTAEQGISIVNPYATETLVNSVFESVGGFKYRPCRFEQILGDIRLDESDVITVETKSETFKTIPMSYDLNFDGGVSIDFVATGPEVGKEYLSPQQLQDKKTESNNRNNTLVVFAENDEQITVDTSLQNVVSLSFFTERESLPFIVATIQLEQATQDTITAVLRVNGSNFATYRINASEGYNLVNFSNAFTNLLGGSQRIDILVSGGSAVIQPKGANAILTGSGLLEKSGWDGFIDLNDSAKNAIAYAEKIVVESISDSVGIDVAEPTARFISETITGILSLASSVDFPAISEKNPYNFSSIQNTSNSAIDITITNPVVFQSGEIDLSGISLIGKINGVETPITVTGANIFEIGVTMTNRIQLATENLSGFDSEITYIVSLNAVNPFSGEQVNTITGKFQKTNF